MNLSTAGSDSGAILALSSLLRKMNGFALDVPADVAHRKVIWKFLRVMQFGSDTLPGVTAMTAWYLHLIPRRLHVEEAGLMQKCSWHVSVSMFVH